MLARVWSAAIAGIDAIKVGVEVDVAGGAAQDYYCRVARYSNTRKSGTSQSSLKEFGICLSCQKNCG